MTTPKKLSIKAAALCGLTLSLALSGTALALPAIGSVAVGNGISTTGRVADIPIGRANGSGLVTVTALSPHTSKEGSVGNVKLLNSQTLVGVAAGPASAGHQVGLANPTGRPVFSSVSNVPSLNGVVGPQ